MMSTTPCLTMARICSRYSSRVLKRTSPECASGDWPGEPMPKAMSASLASARVNSRQDDGFAWIAASLRSRVLTTSAPLARDRDPGLAARGSSAAGAHRHPHAGPIPRRLGGGLGERRPPGGVGVGLQDLVD